MWKCGTLTALRDSLSRLRSMEKEAGCSRWLRHWRHATSMTLRSASRRLSALATGCDRSSRSDRSSMFTSERGRVVACSPTMMMQFVATVSPASPTVLGRLVAWSSPKKERMPWKKRELCDSSFSAERLSATFCRKLRKHCEQSGCRRVYR